MKYWKYSYYNQTFRNEPKFGIKLPIKSWYAANQLNETKEEPNNRPFFFFFF